MPESGCAFDSRSNVVRGRNSLKWHLVLWEVQENKSTRDYYTKWHPRVQWNYLLLYWWDTQIQWNYLFLYWWDSQVQWNYLLPVSTHQTTQNNILDIWHTPSIYLQTSWIVILVMYSAIYSYWNVEMVYYSYVLKGIQLSILLVRSIIISSICVQVYYSNIIINFLLKLYLSVQAMRFVLKHLNNFTFRNEPRNLTPSMKDSKRTGWFIWEPMPKLAYS